MIETSARLLDGSYVEFTVPVPTVELALVIKALSFAEPDVCPVPPCRQPVSPHSSPR